MSIHEQLAGTSWSLAEYRSVNKKGDLLYPLGSDARGIIMFSLDGRMSVQIMAAGREADPAVLAAFNTAAEREMAEKGYHAYTGPFELNEAEAVLTTHVELSLLRSYVGSDQRCSVKIENGSLYLSNLDHPERQLVWTKIEAAKA